MRKSIAYITTFLTMMVLFASQAYAFDVSPAVNSNTAQVTGFSGNELQVVNEVKQGMAERIQKLNELDQQYPGSGFGTAAADIQTKLNAINNTTLAKGSTLWGSTPAYVSAGNSVCLTDNFFDNSCYSTDSRIALLCHEGTHLDQYRAYRYGSNFVNGATLGFVSKPSETNSYIEEYKVLRMLGCDYNGFAVQNAIQALVEQGVIPDTKSTDNLDNQLGLQKAFEIVGKGIDNVGIENRPGGTKTGTDNQNVTLQPGQKMSLSGNKGQQFFATAPGQIPDSVGWTTTIQIPGAGKLTYKAGHATTMASGPRFYGDEMGYRSQAAVNLIGTTVRQQNQFSNWYDTNYSYIDGSFEFSAPEILVIRMIPQGASAAMGSISKEPVTMSDGDGYLYFDASFTLELTFEPSGGSVNSGSSNGVGSDDIKVLIGGQPVVSDTAPIIENGRTLLPLRAIFESLGADVSYLNGVVTAVSGGKVITLTIGSTAATVNGETVELDVAPKLVNSRTMVPVRFVAEALGKKVQWDQDSRSVLIE